MPIRNTYLLLFLFLPFFMSAQTISGFVQDEENSPVPFAAVYIKNTNIQTRTDVEGKYFIQLSDVGSYDFVVQASGFEDYEFRIVYENIEDKYQNIWLTPDKEQLNELLVTSKRRDPAYGIIASAIDHKKIWNKQLSSSTSDVYIKAKEIISEKEKKKRKKRQEQEAKEKEQEADSEADLFAKQEAQRKAEINKIAYGMNMVEINMKRHYAFPNKVKEIREGFKQFGSKYGLFYLRTTEADFNFYDNLMSLDKLNELPVVSPLNTTSILTYKFKLEETYFVGQNKIYKIAVTPRKQGNASWSGFIYIQDETFHIVKTDLSLSKEGLYIYNSFNIKQEYELMNDTLALLKSQEFDYTSRGGGRNFQGNTLVQYSNYQINPSFPKRFFKNEVAVTTQEAYDRDTSYWEKSRPAPLSKEEQRYQKVKDSIQRFLTSEVYLDSIDSVFNRVTALDLLWDGVGFSDRKTKRYLYINSAAGMIDPFEIAGLRVGQDLYFFKKFENEKFIVISPGADIGLRNKDIKYDFSFRMRYDPMHLGYFGFYTGKMFNTIVENDALSNIFQRSNWIEEDRFTIYSSREIMNGVTLGGNLAFVNRLPIGDYDFGEITEDWFGGNNPLEFENYQSSIATFYLAITPFQKYMTEPYRKVVLGSKWPNFRFVYQRGVPDLFGSDIDFSYFGTEIRQSFKLGTIGTSNYSAEYAKFLDKKDLRYVDYIIYPRGDKWFFASQLESMQIQDTTLAITDEYYRINYRHHFNGAIINYVPLIKKLGIHTVAGASTLFITESNYRYVEGYFGIERSFKAERARYRIGVYFVEAVSNYSNIPPRIKFAFNRYNLRDQSWTY